MQNLPWRNVGPADNPVVASSDHLSLMFGRYMLTKVITVHNKGKTWFEEQCRHALDHKQEADHWYTRDCSRVNWEEFAHCQMRKPTQRPGFSLESETPLSENPVISGCILLRVLCSARVRRFLRWVVGVVDCCVSRLVRLICCQIILTVNSILTANCWSASHLPYMVIHSTTFAFGSSEVRPLLLDLHYYGGTDPFVISTRFLHWTTDVLACLSLALSECLDSFSACWRQDNVTQIPKVRFPTLLPIFDRFT